MFDKRQRAPKAGETPTPNVPRLRFVVRTLGFGSLLVVWNCFWLIATENRYVHTGGLSVFTIFPTVITTLLCLSAANALTMRLRPAWAFTPGEMACLYSMVSIGTALAGHDVIKQLVPYMGNFHWFATPENDWVAMFHAYLPKWLTVQDRSVLQGWYEGGATFWKPEIIRAWLTPFVAWTVFTCVILGGMLCANIILKQQWIQHEKLNYPIAQLPISMIGDGRRFFGNRLMWIGFAVAFGTEMMSGLHFLVPAIPMVAMKYNLDPLFTEKPWNAMHGMPIFLYPFAMGLAFLMPVDLSFSFWFFFLVWKAQFIVADQLGLPPGDWWHAEQRAGAWIALALSALWAGRRHVGQAFQQALGLREGDDSRLYRWAVVGLVASGLFILVFSRVAGLQLWAALLYFMLYFVFCVAATRMRAELGPPTHELHLVHPDRIMVLFAGVRRVGARNLTVMELYSWLSYGYRCHPMPHQMEGFKIGEHFRVGTRRLVVAMLVAGVVGAIAGIGFHIVLMYRYRQIYIMRGPDIQLSGWLSSMPGPDLANVARLCLGAGITFILSFMRRRFLSWPLSPVGYAVSYGWAIGWMWFSIFLGWVAKRLALSFGGIRAYRQFVPLFIGLVLGQFVAGSLWCLFGLIAGRTVYSPFP